VTTHVSDLESLSHQQVQGRSSLRPHRGDLGATVLQKQEAKVGAVSAFFVKQSTMELNRIIEFATNLHDNTRKKL
jgi:hypothetical protein